MTPGLPQIVEALALQAEREAKPQPVPARLLRDMAEALADLAYVGQHGDAWAQRIAREGRAGVVVALRERGPAAAGAPVAQRGPEVLQPGDSP